MSCHLNDYVMNLLTNIRINSIYLSEYHDNRFFTFKLFSKYFDLSILILSAFISSFSMGAYPYLSHNFISPVSCFSGISICIITSVKLYLNNNIKSEMKLSKDFYTISNDIFRILTFDTENRKENGINYLKKNYNVYTKLVEKSNLLRKRFIK